MEQIRLINCRLRIADLEENTRAGRPPQGFDAAPSRTMVRHPRQSSIGNWQWKPRTNLRLSLVEPNCPVADAGVPRAGSHSFSSQAGNFICSFIFNWPAVLAVWHAFCGSEACWRVHRPNSHLRCDMATLLQDLRYGFSILAENPRVSALALITLGRGIRPQGAPFCGVFHVLLPPPPSPQPPPILG